MVQAPIDFNAHIEAVFALLKHLTPQEKELVKQNATCFFYRKGEMIYNAGEKPVGLICLIKGKVKVSREGIGGRDWISRMANAGEVIGYRALFAESNYSASAQTIEDSSICIINKDCLFKVLHANADVCLTILKLIATELGFSNKRTVTLTQKHIRGRLAESLLFLLETYGYEDDGQTLKVYLSREDLANLSNMTTSNAIRTLSNLNTEGVIALDGRKIKILNLQQLEKISRIG